MDVWMKHARGRPVGLRAWTPTLILLLLLHPACITDREDAEALRDEKVFQDMVPPERAGGDREDAARDAGRRIRDWAAAYEGAETITLAECFRLALANEETLALQGEKLLEADARAKEAVSTLLPQVDFHYRYSHDNKEIRFEGFRITPRDSSESWISASQTVFDGRAIAAVSAAKAARRIEGLRLSDHRDRVLFSVAAAFYAVLGLEQDVETEQAALERAREGLRVAGARARAGEASRQEVLAASAEREATEARLVQARNDLAVARSDLRRLVGLEALPPRLVDEYTVTFTPGAVPELTAAAERNRPDLGAARAAVDLAEADRKATLSEYLPRISADYTYWLRREGAFTSDIDWNLSLNFTWSLFDSGGREARMTQAYSRYRQRAFELAALEKSVRHEVEEAVRSFLSLDRSLAAFRSRADSVKKALGDVQARFQVREAAALDVATAREAWRQAERDRARAALARKLAALRIHLVVGDFPLSAPAQSAMETAKEDAS